MRLILAALCIASLSGCASSRFGRGAASAPLAGASFGVQANIPNFVPTDGTAAMTVAPATTGFATVHTASVCTDAEDVTPPPVFTVHRKTPTLAK